MTYDPKGFLATTCKSCWFLGWFTHTGDCISNSLALVVPILLACAGICVFGIIRQTCPDLLRNCCKKKKVEKEEEHEKVEATGTPELPKSDTPSFVTLIYRTARGLIVGDRSNVPPVKYLKVPQYDM